MSSNNGQKLLVFGLGFAQHDSRKMQQVLRHYDRMPSNPGSRAALFVELTKLGKELALDEDEEHQIQAQKVEAWMRDGGVFPLGITPAPINAAEQRVHVDHMPMASGPGSPPDRTSRFARPGHALENPQDGDDSGNDGHSIIESQQEAGTNDHDYDTESEDSDIETEHEDDDTYERTVASATAAFSGRGRTLNDAEELADITEEQNEAAPPIPAPRTGNFDNGVVVPQLRGDHQWRGNNVHGLQNHGMGIAMVVPHHGRRPRPRPHRPRMEHDLEDEDEDGMDGLGGWVLGHGHFALGPGRTLDDPEPQQNQDLIPEIAAEDPSPDDDSPDSDFESEDAPSASNIADDDADPIECPICLETFGPSGFPKRATITELCDHPDKACLQCLDASITSIIETGALHILACPICPQKLAWRDVKEYASKKVYERYKYLRQQALRPGHYISCTNAKCGGSQPHDVKGPNGPKMVCNFCQAETCAKHRRPWHEGQTCIEFDMDPAQIERLEEEEATAKLLATEASSICPKCGQGVTKTEGCDHMMCQCGTEWCYVCSCSWENILRIGATAHATFCIYHPNKVSLSKTQQNAARARIMGLVHGGEVSAELTKARDEFRQRRREEMRPKLAEAAEARMKQALEQKRQNSSSTGETPPRKKNKVKLVPAWEEGGRTKKAL